MEKDAAQWLTFREFATAAGVSTQALYKQVAKRLQPYIKEENGSKYIDKAALELFGVDNRLQSGCKQVDNELTTGCNPESEAEKAALDTLREITTEQGRQLDELRNQVDGLREKLHEAEQAAAVAAAERDAALQRAAAAESRERMQAEQITAHLAALDSAQKQQQALTDALTAAQALHAGTIQKQLETSADASGGQIGADGEPDDSIQKRRGIFARLFRK